MTVVVASFAIAEGLKLLMEYVPEQPREDASALQIVVVPFDLKIVTVPVPPVQLTVAFPPPELVALTVKPVPTPVTLVS